MDQPRVRALVLDRAHRCLLVADGPATVAIAAPERRLQALKSHFRDRFGIALPAPSGSRVPADGRGPRDFVFVIDECEPPPGTRWAPLAKAARDDWLWSLYVDRMLGGWEPPTRELTVFAFGRGAEMASRLAHLVTCGAKRGTSTWFPPGDTDAPPRPGLISIVTDAFGHPRCAIRTDSVERVRFDAMPAHLAALEGEGDLTLASWREGHLRFFSAEAEELSLSFTGAEEILFERFSVLHIIGRRD
jgi:uncharacterized protein YhfF